MYTNRQESCLRWTQKWKARPHPFSSINVNLGEEQLVAVVVLPRPVGHQLLDVGQVADEAWQQEQEVRKSSELQINDAVINFVLVKFLKRSDCDLLSLIASQPLYLVFILCYVYLLHMAVSLIYCFVFWNRLWIFNVLHWILLPFLFCLYIFSISEKKVTSE